MVRQGGRGGVETVFLCPSRSFRLHAFVLTIPLVCIVFYILSLFWQNFHPFFEKE